MMAGPRNQWMEIQAHVEVFVQDYVQMLVQVVVVELVEIHVRVVGQVVVDNAAVIVQVAVVLNV